MSYIRYNIHKTTQTEITEAVKDLLRNIWEREQPIRLVFFGPADNNTLYLSHLQSIRQVIKDWFPDEYSPLVSYVAQRPVDCAFALETQNISKEYCDILRFKEEQGIRYATFESERNEKMIFTSGILASDINAPIKQQSEEVFTALKAIFDKEHMTVKTIDRQWNYIEHITRNDGKTQHYQEFNDARSAFYADTHWTSGYPAATGIGTAAGGVLVEVDAAMLSGTRTVALDNTLQVAAHEYTKEVLHGEQSLKTTPKFERARAIVYQSVFGDAQANIYISGTAAIRGQQSLTDMGIEQQTITTLDNIEYLISLENLKKHNIGIQKKPQIQNFRVYLKHETHYQPAQEIIAKRYPTVAALYVLSDVCRDELLIEIEGTAE